MVQAASVYWRRNDSELILSGNQGRIEPVLGVVRAVVAKRSPFPFLAAPGALVKGLGPPGLELTLVGATVSSVIESGSSERREVRYAGQVQGVGFRFQTLRIARAYEVAGFVRNLPDGRVQLVAEGVRDQLDRFLGDVAETMSGYIRDCATETSAATGEFSEFLIRY